MFLFLKYIFLKLIEIYNFIFNVYKFSIYKVELTYNHDGKTNYHTSNIYWKNQRKFIIMNDEKINNEYYDDVTRNYLMIGKPPKGISNVLFRIKYYYKNKKFICLSPTPSVDIENTKSTEMKFKMPLKEVRLLDSDDKVKHVVTKKYLKIIGPHNNFHNITTPKVLDLFYFNDYEFIEIINIANQKSKFSKEVSLVELL